MLKIGILVGSLRNGAYSQKVADVLAQQLAENYEITFIPIGDLPLYNEDLDNDTPPEAWNVFRNTAKEMDAYLFVTPEYNRSVPAVLKNALDVGSRPYGHSVWNQKPGAVISVSPGGMGGFGANHHLRQVLTFLNIYTMQQPEAYIAGIAGNLDESGAINAHTTDFLHTIADSFDTWIKRF